MKLKATTFHKGSHLTEKNLLGENSKCFFCSGCNLRKVDEIQSDPIVSLSECQACRAISVSRLPRPEALRRYYKRYYKQSNQDKITFDNSSRLVSHIISGIGKYNLQKPVINILDFGGGDGTISLALAGKLLGEHQRANILVVDFAKVKSSPPKNVKIKSANSLPSRGEYDIVLASAVLEHSPRPAQDLKKLFRLMADGGSFYARTPYITPLRRLARYFGVKIDFTYPSHLHDLGPDFWNKIFLWLDEKSLSISISRPSIVETTLSGHLFRTLAAHILKAPWYLLKNKYRLVGGWEVYIYKDKAV